MLPGEAEHVKARRPRYATRVHDASLLVGQAWDVDPCVVGPEPVAHTTASKSAALPSAKVTVRRPRWSLAPEADAVAPGEPRGPGPTPGPAGEAALAVSRGHWSSRSAVAHFQMSRPSGRCGIAGIRWRPRVPRRGSPRVPGRSGTRSSRRRPPGPFPAGHSAGAGSRRCGSGTRWARASRRSAG